MAFRVSFFWQVYQVAVVPGILPKPVRLPGVATSHRLVRGGCREGGALSIVAQRERLLVCRAWWGRWPLAGRSARGYAGDNLMVSNKEEGKPRQGGRGNPTIHG